MMLNEALLLTIVVSQAVILALLVWVVCEYIRLRRRYLLTASALRFWIENMECDELIDQLLEQQDAQGSKHDSSRPVLPQESADMAADMRACQKNRRERLAALVAGGQARPYLGRTFTVEEIDAMGDDEIAKLYGRYEARLGAAMTKTISQAVLQLYGSAAAKILPIPPENQPKLVADLEADPFVAQALLSATCELYHRYGTCLAPITAALTTVRYCQFGDGPCITDDDGQSDDGSRGDSCASACAPRTGEDN